MAADDCLISADEKTSIQARMRIAPTSPPRPGQAMRVEHEYGRGGALAYRAAWDVRRGGVLGRCEATTGIASFGLLVDQVMQREPYRSAPRVFWVVDNGSSHRGTAAAERLQAQYPNLVLVHLPTPASAAGRDPRRPAAGLAGRQRRDGALQTPTLSAGSRPGAVVAADAGTRTSRADAEERLPSGSDGRPRRTRRPGASDGGGGRCTIRAGTRSAESRAAGRR